MCMHRLYVYGLVPLLLGSLTGCETQVTLTPTLSAPVAPACVIAAPLSYDGQPAYLPQVIAAQPAADQATVLRYSYDTQYKAKQQVTALQPSIRCS